MHFVSVLVCLKTGRSYSGQTDDLIRGFRVHQAGSTRATGEKLIAPVMVHWVAYPTRSEAMKKERYFKTGSGHRVKREIIASARKEFWPEG